MSSPTVHPDLPWRKSSYSSAQGNDCVEVAPDGHMIAVRDSKDPNGPRLSLGRAAWSALNRRIEAGELNR